ncbi:hypothetical protein [Cryptosporangium sp. NPDC051539]|uniref:hypothetical protein n=1 Tax=Cryptosporangium sp. NPDC051539 TaxID=3363962 RepID=UPI003797DDE6
MLRTSRAAALLALVVAVLTITAAPAQAHGADAKPGASDYRSAITAITPETEGLTIRVVENGARLELRNHTDQDVVVSGYSGEPYLKVTPAGVFTNTRSPATWINATADGTSKAPASAHVDTAAEPQWQKVASTPKIRWHDQRNRWVSGSPPPIVAADPSSAHRISTWKIDLLVAGTATVVTGTLDYEAPPATPLWWAGAGLVAAGLFALTYFRGGRPAARRIVAAALGVAALAELTDAVGRTLVEGATGIGVLTALLTGQGVGVLVGVAALSAAVLALGGADAGPFAVAFAGACLALLGGLPDYDVFAHAVAPVPWPGPVARVLAVLVLGGSVGAALSAWWWLLRARRAAAARAAA